MLEHTRTNTNTRIGRQFQRDVLRPFDAWFLRCSPSKWQQLSCRRAFNPGSATAFSCKPHTFFVKDSEVIPFPVKLWHKREVRNAYGRFEKKRRRIERPGEVSWTGDSSLFMLSASYGIIVAFRHFKWGSDYCKMNSKRLYQSLNLRQRLSAFQFMNFSLILVIFDEISLTSTFVLVERMFE